MSQVPVRLLDGITASALHSRVPRRCGRDIVLCRHPAKLLDGIWSARPHHPAAARGTQSGLNQWSGQPSSTYVGPHSPPPLNKQPPVHTPISQLSQGLAQQGLGNTGAGPLQPSSHSQHWSAPSPALLAGRQWQRQGQPGPALGGTQTPADAVAALGSGSAERPSMDAAREGRPQHPSVVLLRPAPCLDPVQQRRSMGAWGQMRRLVQRRGAARLVLEDFEPSQVSRLKSGSMLRGRLRICRACSGTELVLVIGHAWLPPYSWRT